jgi:hypothetical protein
MKGAWTMFPDYAYVSFVVQQLAKMRRLSALVRVLLSWFQRTHVCADSGSTHSRIQVAHLQSPQSINIRN